MDDRNTAVIDSDIHITLRSLTALDTLRTALLGAWKIDYGIVNCIYGVPMIHNDDWAAAMARALNDWQLAEWLEPEPRLRGSILVPLQNADFAAQEIDRLGDNRRFVQILLPEFMRKQHLDGLDIEYGMLNCLSGSGSQLNPEFSAALTHATDYPHWDFDDPDRAPPAGLSQQDREQIFSGNARSLYGLA